MKNKYQAIYEKLAKQNGVTPQQVREDMAQAIRFAYENPQDEQTRQFQQLVPRKGEIPTPEEMMDFVAQQCSERQNNPFC
ncbi:sporulation initiation factor Spo0A C-terminal domain-containing protein [uncultured Negativibacillus sp.]|uniref:sporulation initiation factor Spo0A C-terminal domain-containing protein n=1 Tax=uncultured Negativibacillus sp. TaxID=1980696 RepID=UPI0025F35CCC|nr:sporulation initiation factor Spo0A C-terminal domain-containing protein [uncultured Negativibacillus sp.]